MTSTVLFSIRRMLAMVAVVGGLCASLHYANPTAVTIMQACLLIALVTFAVLAVSGSVRMRRFGIAALAAALIHVYLANQNSVNEPSVMNGASPGSVPTVTLCYWLWERIKVPTPMSSWPTPTAPSYSSVYVMPPSSSPAYPVPVYSGPVATYAPSGSSSAPTLAGDPPPNAADPSLPNDVSSSPPQLAVPTVALEPAPAIDGQSEAPPSEGVRPVSPVEETLVPAVPLPPSAAVGPYISPMTSMPMVYSPDLGSFLQIGILDATLLIGVVAGCAALVVDDLRRRNLRKAAHRSVTG